MALVASNTLDPNIPLDTEHGRFQLDNLLTLMSQALNGRIDTTELEEIVRGELFRLKPRRGYFAPLEQAQSPLFAEAAGIVSPAQISFLFGISVASAINLTVLSSSFAFQGLNEPSCKVAVSSIPPSPSFVLADAQIYVPEQFSGWGRIPILWHDTLTGFTGSVSRGIVVSRTRLVNGIPVTGNVIPATTTNTGLGAASNFVTKEKMEALGPWQAGDILNIQLYVALSALSAPGFWELGLFELNWIGD